MADYRTLSQLLAQHNPNAPAILSLLEDDPAKGVLVAARHIEMSDLRGASYAAISAFVSGAYFDVRVISNGFIEWPEVAQLAFHWAIEAD